MRDGGGDGRGASRTVSLHQCIASFPRVVLVFSRVHAFVVAFQLRGVAVAGLRAVLGRAGAVGRSLLVFLWICFDLVCNLLLGNLLIMIVNF